MKRYLIALLSVALLFSACKKDDDDYQKAADKNRPDSPERPDGPIIPQMSPLVQILDSAIYYTPESFFEVVESYPMIEMLSSVSPTVNTMFKGMVSLSQRSNIRTLDSLFDARVGRDAHGQRQWATETYSFSYRSISSQGMPIILSGRVTFPNNTVRGVAHELSTISLYGHMMYMQDSWSATENVTIMSLRSMMNSAVIEPDFQGYGVDSLNRNPGLAGRTLGQQMLDCAMAALEIMRSRNVRLADDGYTTNWAISLSAIASLGATRFYELEASDELRRALRLRSTFATEGPLDPMSNILYATIDTTFNTPLDQYFSNFGAMYIPSKYGYDEEDFCADWMRTTMIPYGDTAYSYIYYKLHKLGRNSRDYRPADYQQKSPAWNFAPDMLTPDGEYDMNSPKLKAFIDVFDNETRWTTWTPTTNIYMGHCKDDDFQPYGTARKLFERFHAKAPNNVHWYEIPRPAGNTTMDLIAKLMSYSSSTSGMTLHYVVSLLNMLYITNVENPEEMVIYYPIVD